MYHSHSNPDLTSICYEDPRADYPEHVLKVFKADQTCKYLLTNKVLASIRHPIQLLGRIQLIPAMDGMSHFRWNDGNETMKRVVSAGLMICVDLND